MSQDLRDEYDTSQLLAAVDHLDQIRGLVADGEYLEPPQVRQQLLKLHGLAMAVINGGRPLTSERKENLAALAFEVEAVVEDIQDAADRILKSVRQLVDVLPEEDELGEE